jgi:peptidoglycan/xylan/chitin deacetylase (PgdA/CDA1 family)
MRKIFLAGYLIILSLGAFYFFWLSPRYTVPILMYHNIGSEKGSFFVSPENFTKQMEYIKKHGYQVISLDELVSSIQKKIPLKRNRVVITFDDGYRDNFQYAYPVLKKLRFSATIFLISDFVGKTFSGNKEFLNWEEVVTMSKNGISFGAHTKTHFYFGGPWVEKTAQDEVVIPKKVIEEKTGLAVDYFCYPSGGFNDQVKALVIKAGYKGACSTNRGFSRFNRDVYELKRIKVSNTDAVKPFSFAAKLSGFYTIFKRGRNPY